MSFNIQEKVNETQNRYNDKVKDLTSRFSIEELKIAKEVIQYWIFSKEQFLKDDKEHQNYEQNEFIGLDEQDCNEKLGIDLLEVDIILHQIFEKKDIK